MGFDQGTVEFDQTDLIYYPGQMVRGRLAFQQDKDKIFRGIYLKTKGFCQTHWRTRHTRSSNGKSETYYRTHEARETYYENKIYLMGGETGEAAECHIEPGAFSFPFETLIPPGVPSSYESEHANIRYTFKFVVDRAFKIDQQKKLEIKVVAPYDLNSNPLCREPMLFNFDDHFTCCCASRGNVETTAKVPYSGFCAGQNIPIQLSCDNQSRDAVLGIKFEIKEKITLHSTDAKKYTSQVIAQLRKGPVTSGTSRNWELEMVIPPMEVYNMERCKLIDIDYDFKVKIKAGECNSNSEALKRIFLGHIPLIAPNVENNSVQLQAMQTPYPNLSPYPGAFYPEANLGENITYPNSVYPTDNSQYPSGYNDNENAPFLPANPPYPESSDPTSTSEKSPPYPEGQIGNPMPYNPSVNAQIPPNPTLPYPSIPAMPMPSMPTPSMPTVDSTPANESNTPGQSIHPDTPPPSYAQLFGQTPSAPEPDK